MKPHWIIGIAGVSIIASGIAGYVRGTAAALVGGGVFTFAILYALVYYIFDSRPKKVRKKENETEEVLEPTINEVKTYNEKLENLSDSDEFLKENDIVRDFMEEFGISRDKAQNLYDAGYSHWGDFSEAIPEDLVMVEGINPTISRRIITVVRTKL